MSRFIPVVGLTDLPSHDTLEAAFRAFHPAVMKAMKGGGAWQFLDTCWIKAEGAGAPYFFGELVDIAHEKGWLKEGKLQPR